MPRVQLGDHFAASERGGALICFKALAHISVGGIVLFYITGKVLKQTGNYLPVFVLASLSYVTALVIIHILVPKLEPAKIDAA